jgi:cell division protein FtsL
MTAPLRAPVPLRREAPPQARPDLRVVPRRRPRRLRAITTVALTMAFGIAFALVVLQTVLVQGQQRLDQIDERIAEEGERFDELRLQVAQLESPGRIVDAAVGLGMVTPPEVTYLTPAAPAPAGP